jgi:hypothetical protein
VFGVDDERDAVWVMAVSWGGIALPREPLREDDTLELLGEEETHLHFILTASRVNTCNPFTNSNTPHSTALKLNLNTI